MTTEERAMTTKEREDATRVCQFIRRMCDSNYPPAFILERGFAFSLLLSLEQSGEKPDLLEAVNTDHLSQALTLMDDAINLDQRLVVYLQKGAKTV